MGVNERDLFTFAILAGLWIRDRKPPVVRKALRISSECGSYTSSPLFERSLQRLVRAGWLALRKEKRRVDEVNRYIPTAKGFVEFADRFILGRARQKIDLAPYHCIHRHVPLIDVEIMSLNLKTVLDIYNMWVEGGNRFEELPQQMREIVQAIIEAKPADAIPYEYYEWLRQELPAWECELLTIQLYRVRTRINYFRQRLCANDKKSELAEIVRSLIVAEYKLLKQCCHMRGPKCDSEWEDVIQKDLEDELRRLEDDVNKSPFC